MSGSFGGLSTALSALYAQRRGLEVTGQNIANANTEGYSRQRVNLESIGTPLQPAIHSIGDPAAGGVTVSGVTRIHDEFLDARSRAERGQGAYLAGQQSTFSRIEDVVGEPSDTGLQSQLSEFWGAWHDVSNRPGDSAARTQVVQRAIIVADELRSVHDGLDSLWVSSREQLDAIVTDVNNIAGTVARLNDGIMRAGQTGMPTSELADQRDLQVLRLSELTGATALPRPDGSVDVSIAGSSLVAGGSVRLLGATGAARMADQGADPVTLRWLDSSAPASVGSGKLASSMETLGTTLPKYGASLDQIASQLATTVNAQHKLGFDQNGLAGGDFFTGTDATSLQVAITDPKLVAASASATNRLDGSNADLIGAVAKAVGGADQVYREFVIDLGVSAQTVNRRAEIQNALTQDVDAAREANAGVNLDEEMTNLLQYQRAYEAAAKVISAIDQMLNVLINATGR